MATWAELLGGAEPGDHLVQFYGDDDRLLSRNVSRFLAEGLRRGDGVVVIATPEHTRAIVRHLVDELPGPPPEGRIAYLDAGETLRRLEVHGSLTESRFRSVIGDAVAPVRARSTTGTVRAFGEMVNLLWHEGRHEDAHHLEELWNAVLAEYRCSLFCAYGIDLFARPADAASLQPLIATHHHVFAGAGTLISSGRPRPS